MKQLYYTSCLPDHSLNGQAGFQVRAVSRQVGPACIEAVVAHAGYARPPSQDRERQADPVRLAFLRTAHHGRLLCHSCTAGTDPTTHRGGNFFSHLLFDLPEGLNAPTAIRLWASDFWRRRDNPQEPVHLVEVEEISPGSALDEQQLRRFLKPSSCRHAMASVLWAVLTAPTDQRVFVVAPAEVVAMLIFGLTRLMPAALADDLTFSTYEASPLNCATRIVGTLNKESLLTRSSLAGPMIEVSEAPDESAPDHAYVQFAIECGLAGRWASLDRVRAASANLQLADLTTLKLLAQAEREQAAQFSAEVFLEAAQRPGLVAHLAQEPQVLRRIVRLAIEQVKLAPQVLPMIAQVLPRLAAERNELIVEVQDRAQEAFQAGRLDESDHLLEVILPALSTESAHDCWVHLLRHLEAPQSLPWAMRMHALSRLACLGDGQLPAELDRWLPAEGDQLARLLQQPLPVSWKARSCRQALDGPQPVEPATLAALVSRDPSLTSCLVQTLAREPEHHDHLIPLFYGLAERSYANAALAVLLDERAGLSDCDLLGRMLQGPLEKGLIDGWNLALAQGRPLIERLAGTASLDLLLEHCQRRLVDHPKIEGSTASLFRMALEHGKLDSQWRQRLESWLDLEAFCADRCLDREHMAALAAACATLGADVRRWRPQLLEVILEALGETGGDDLVRTTSTLVEQVGPTWPQASPGLYGQLLACHARRRTFWRNRLVLEALWITGCRGDGMEAAVEPLHRQAEALACEINRRSPRRVLRWLDRRANDWPRPAAVRWEALMQTRPNLLSRWFLRWWRVRQPWRE